MAEGASDLSEIDAVILAPLVRDLLGEPAAALSEDWSCHPLGGGAGEGLGLYRIEGSARVGSTVHPWAMVVKISAASDGPDPSAWDYPAREGLAYGTGLLAALPGGLTAPRCLTVEALPDGTTRLWLEAVADAHPGPWPRDRYAQAAHTLGRFNGAYLVGTPLPSYPWLSRGWLRDFLQPSGPVIAALEDYVSASPLARKLYPPPVVSEFERLWADRERFLTALDRLPRTFCHHDAFRRNLMFRAGTNGDELVAVDWAYAGHGGVGEDLEQLTVASHFFFEVVAATPTELDAACFPSYVEGLRDAGWTGDERLVRLGFTAAAALRHTVALLHLIIPGLSDPAAIPFVEEVWGRPIDDVVEGWAELWPYQFALAEEARTLLPLIR